MRRFTLTPTPRKSIHLSTATPRTSFSMDESKRNCRNIRDREYKQMCADFIYDFLVKNKYDGVLSRTTLASPSNKDFQKIVRFIFSFIDPNPITKFEDEIIQTLKTLKYPYCNEITRSQLCSITPHAWPSILSMIYWIVEMLENCEKIDKKEQTVESEFFNFVCAEYDKFMNNEEDGTGEKEFLEKIKNMHSKEIEEIETTKEEIDLLENELKTIQSKFEDIDKLQNKKKKQMEDMNMLMQHSKQMESKKDKLVKVIDGVRNEIEAMEKKIDLLIKEEKSVKDVISDQEIIIEDIDQLQSQNMELMLELDRIKPVRDQLIQSIKELDNELIIAQEKHDNVINEISAMRNGEVVEATFNLTDFDNELSSLKEALVNFEINNKNLEESIREREEMIRGHQQQLENLTSKLKTMGAIYAEKKDLFDHQQQQSINELDRLENDLLKLKLESVSGLQKNEKELSERRIQMDLLEAQISRDSEEINKLIWEIETHMKAQIAKSAEIENEIIKLLNRKC